MIVVHLQGGLGNQMFQYALGLRLAHERRLPLLFDVAHFSDTPHPAETPRNFELSQWNTRIHLLAGDERLDWQEIQKENMLDKIRRRLFHTRTFIRVEDTNVDSFLHERRFLNIPNIELRGYFQKEVYFSSVADEVRGHFTPVYPVSLQYNATCQVSVHVRRGDYVQSEAASQWHGVCSNDYYLNAMTKLRHQLTSPLFILFSDDIPWCKQTFGHLNDVVFHESPAEEGSYADIWRMSRCHHHIIANSSYSWWGAWLNPSDKKIVIAPARWLAGQQTPFNQYVPHSWIQM